VRSGRPAKSGTRGNASSEPSGNLRATALLAMMSQVAANELARKREVSSVWAIGGPATRLRRRGRLRKLRPGRRMEQPSVPSWSAAIKGQMRKTKDAGVTSVGKTALKAALDVGPTLAVMAAMRALPKGGIGIVIIVVEMRPK